jgi:hypothetical protein
MIPRLDPVLLWVSVGFAALALVSALALALDASPILAVHPALKPMKFAISIAIFLVTMSALVPALSVSEVARAVLRWLFVSIMVAEMAAIAFQAGRGTTSHYNTASQFDRRLLAMMLAGIAILTIVMVGVALVATLRPLVDGEGRPLATVQTAAWRAGLWIFQLASVSGFAMGGRGRHTVGGVDGGPGIAIVNWSAQHGDLRVPHFLAMHGLQVIPLAALLVGGLAYGWIVVTATTLGYVALTVWTLVRAFAGLPPW